MSDDNPKPAPTGSAKRGSAGDFIAGLAIFLLGAYALYESINMPYYGDSGVLGSPGLTPGLIAGVLLLLSAMLMFRARGFSWPDMSFSIDVNMWRGLLALGIILVYVAVLPFIGYAPATFAMLVVFQLVFAPVRNWRYMVIWCLGLSAFLTAVLYYVFAEFFLIPLP
ncbi:MAG: tripartite tricarboxylate transporter TctB family protein [Hyphomicrobiaceae bacterium]